MAGYLAIIFLGWVRAAPPLPTDQQLSDLAAILDPPGLWRSFSEIFCDHRTLR